MNDVADQVQFPLIEASGTANARGVLVGQASRSRIEHSLDTYQRLFKACDISWQQAVEHAMRYLEITQKLSAEFVDELQGVANGSATDFESLFTLNCRTEILPADFLTRVMAKDSRLSSASQSSMAFANECTSLASSSAPGDSWLAQNWDWCGLQRQAMLVVDSQNSSDHRFVTVTEAGMLAKIGINSAGFAITLNILRSAGDGSDIGIPVHVLLRVLLECRSVQEANELIAGLTFSSSSNVMVVDSDGHIASFELSPMGVKVLHTETGCLCHTNHFLHDALARHDVGRPGNQSTLNRLHKARESASEKMTFDEIVTLLCDQSDGLESICRFPDKVLPDIAQIETVCAVIMNPARRTLSVSSAQPSVSGFSHYDLN